MKVVLKKKTNLLQVVKIVVIGAEMYSRLINNKISFIFFSFHLFRTVIIPTSANASFVLLP